MTDLSTTTGPATAVRPQTWQRTLLRWMVSFAGYPVGGAVAILLAGPVDDLRAALDRRAFGARVVDHVRRT